MGIGISFAIGMTVIIPSIKQLGGKMNFEVNLVHIELDKIRLFINVLFNNYIYMFTQKSCFMFSSTLVNLLIPLYYLNKKITKKEKFTFSAIIVFLLLPIISPFLNKLWHAFTIPNCFNYRYSFTLILLLITMAVREYQKRDGTIKKHFYSSGAIFFILTSIEIFFMKNGFLESDGYTVSINSIIISCCMFVLMFSFLYIIYFYKKYKNFTVFLLFFVTIIDLLIGAKSGQNNNDKYFKRETWLQYDNIMKYLMEEKIEVPETERIIFIPDEYGSNMSLKYGYSNIGFFSSGRNRDILKSMYRLGYNVQMDEQLWITSYSGTFLNYSMAGVKYYISKEPLKEKILGFEFDEKYEDFYIYKNKNNFNIGYYLSDDVEESYNPFKTQNDLLNNMSLFDEKNIHFFKPVNNSNSILKCNKNVIYDEKTNEYTITYKIKALTDCSIFIFSDYNLQVFINNEPQFENYSNIWSFETGIKQIKYLCSGEKFEFKIKTKQNLEHLYLYASDNNKIQNVLDNSSKDNYFSDVKINSNGLEGIANFENDGFLTFAINYDENWKIYVDGKEHAKKNICGAFLGVRLEAGKHEIKIVYY